MKKDNGMQEKIQKNINELNRKYLILRLSDHIRYLKNVKNAEEINKIHSKFLRLENKKVESFSDFIYYESEEEKNKIPF